MVVIFSLVAKNSDDLLFFQECSPLSKRQKAILKKFRNVFSQNGEEDSILHVVQMARIFQDSKTFVDMKLRYRPAEIELAYQKLMTNNNEQPSKSAIIQFVNDNFTMENQMEDWIPSDWIGTPKLVNKISDINLANFVSDLNSRWKMLCRKVRNEVQINPELYSLLYLPHPVIIPGGRFREIYYWDTYWVIRGLLQCDMTSTVKGILLNFIHLIKKFGMIPNGGRSYYLNRSQPPLFIPMVREYINATNDIAFLRNNMIFLELEFKYWQDNHNITVYKNGTSYSMFRYNCEDDGPRPESYFEDRTLAETTCQNNEQKRQLYWEMKTGAETGWDYSSRWFINADSKKDIGSLKDTKARSIIPVDLNSILAENARIISTYYKDYFCDEQTSLKYKNISDNIIQGIEKLLWNEEEGAWFDYDVIHGQQRLHFTPSNLWPLWSEAYEADRKIKFTSAAVDYLQKQHLDKFAGGVPATFMQTGEQWDFPNCWPPLEHMLVQGLEKTGLSEGKSLAFQIAQRRIQSAYLNFLEKGHMYEKYNANSVSKVGGGGEYEIQLGFGWTNGVVLDFIDMYRDRLSSNMLSPNNSIEDTMNEP